VQEVELTEDGYGQVIDCARNFVHMFEGMHGQFMILLIMVLLLDFVPCSILQGTFGVSLASVSCRRACIGIVRLRGGRSSQTESDGQATVANEMQEIVGAMTVDYEPNYAEDEKRKVIRDGEHDHRFGSEGDILGNKEKKRKRDDPGRDSGEMGQGGWKSRAGEPRKAIWNGESPGREHRGFESVHLGQVGEGRELSKKRRAASDSPLTSHAKMISSPAADSIGRQSKESHRRGRSEVGAWDRVDRKQGVPKDGKADGEVCKPAQNRDIEWERMPTPPVSEENDIRHDDDVDDDDDDNNKFRAKKAGEGNGVAHSRPSPSTVGSREGEAIERHTRSWPNRYRVLRCNFGIQSIWQH
jgi:hypothetical protein